jgi:hypothetical protein
MRKVIKTVFSFQFKYLVKLQRRYFEVDDEMISVITDIEGTTAQFYRLSNVNN